MSKMFFNMLAVFAEFEADLLEMRTREGMAIARSRGRPKGKQPKLTARQQAELVRMHGHRRIRHRRTHGGLFHRSCDRLPRPRPCQDDGDDGR
jgi:DNA invertase Pin-like site-specific DNA recombinase